MYRSVAPLLKDLGDQKFVVEKTSDGWRVKAPDGKTTVGIHESVIKRPKTRGYENLMANLKRVGFQEGSGVACPDCGERFAKSGMIPKHRREAHGVKTSCPVCGQEFDTPQAMGQHKKKAHAFAIPKEKPKPPRVPRGVSIHHVEEIQEVVDAGTELQAATDKMVVAYKELYRRYTDLQRRQNKIEEQLGKMVQHL